MTYLNNIFWKRVLIVIPLSLFVVVMYFCVTASATDNLCNAQEKIVSQKQISSFLHQFPKELSFVPASDFSEGFAIVETDVTNKYHVIDKSGKIRIKNLDSPRGYFSEGLAAVNFREGNLIKGEGFINKTGSLQIPSSKLVGKTGRFEAGLYAAQLNQQYGFINQQGEWVIRAIFEDVRPFSEGLAAAKSGGKWGFIDPNGIWMIPPQYERKPYEDASLYQFSEGLAGVVLNKQVGYIDRSGKFIIPPKFQVGRSFSEGLVEVRSKSDNAWGYIDALGQWMIPPKFQAPNQFSEGLAGVQLINKRGVPEKYGFINAKGELAFPYQFDNIRPYSEGIASAQLGKGWGYIDHRGKFVIPPIFTYAGKFSEGVGIVGAIETSFGVQTSSRYITHQDISKWLNQCEATRL